MRAATIVCVVFALFVATGVAGQNLLVNPDFEVNLDGWDTFADWDPEDWEGSLDSGSATELNSIPSTSGMPVVDQCVETPTPADDYVLSGWILNPSGQTGQGEGKFYIAFYGSAGCDDPSFISGFDTPDVLQTGVWERVSIAAQTPPGTLSVKVGTVLQKVGEPGEVRIYVDHVALYAGTEIFSDGFETGDMINWETEAGF
jgi:hypothetical protein